MGLKHSLCSTYSAGHPDWEPHRLGREGCLFLDQAQKCFCLKGWFAQRGHVLGFAQRKSTCPLE